MESLLQSPAAEAFPWGGRRRGRRPLPPHTRNVPRRRRPEVGRGHIRGYGGARYAKPGQSSVERYRARGRGLATSAHLLLALIHPSAWKGNSRKFTCRILNKST